MPHRSLFIAMEGIDGSGGTTQTKLLGALLEGRGRLVVLTNEPTDGPVGRFIRSVLRGEGKAGELGDAVLPYLFAGDRRDHLDRTVIPALQRGACVITDRYFHSSLAYQSLAVGLPAVVALNEGFRAPDLTIVLDLPVEESLERVRRRGGALERFEALDRLRKVADAYESVIVHCRTRGDRIERVDGRGTPDEVHARVRALVETLL